MFAVNTGASGHLGVNLVNSLLASRWRVRALVHCNSLPLQGLDIEQVCGNTLNEGSLEKAFDGADVVFNLAAKVSVVGWDRKNVEEINIKGVQNVVFACKKVGVKRLVHVSSFHACCQEPRTRSIDETRQLVEDKNGIPYDYSKACGEKLVKQAIEEGQDAVIISPTGIIGPYDYQPSHFGATLLALARGKLPALVDAGLDWVDARDVAGGMIKAAELPSPAEKYILSGHWVSLKDIAVQISQITGRNKPFFTSPMWLAKFGAPFAAGYNRIAGKRPLFTGIAMQALESNRNVSHEKAAADLGYSPRSLRDTIADTVQWFNDNGYLNYNHKRK
jgi:dihydroflavonol-4-reductase